MAQVALTAYACKFTAAGPGVRCYQWWPMNPALAREVVEITRAGDVQAACDALAAKVEAAHAGSFFVCHRLVKGQRAPAGYRKLPFQLVERDKDLVEI